MFSHGQIILNGLVETLASFILSKHLQHCCTLLHFSLPLVLFPSTLTCWFLTSRKGFCYGLTNQKASFGIGYTLNIYRIFLMFSFCAGYNSLSLKTYYKWQFIPQIYATCLLVSLFNLHWFNSNFSLYFDLSLFFFFFSFFFFLV